MGIKYKRKYKLWALFFLLILIIGFAVWFVWGRGGATPTSGNGNLISFDESAQTGNLPGKTDEEIEAALNSVVDEGMFNISIAPEITFKDGTSKGAVRIENIEANRYHMQVAISLDDTSETVYESGAIKSGQYIESIELSEDLPAGSYHATAVFTALDQKTLEKIGTAAAKITLIIEA